VGALISLFHLFLDTWWVLDVFCMPGYGLGHTLVRGGPAVTKTGLASHCFNPIGLPPALRLSAITLNSEVFGDKKG